MCSINHNKRALFIHIPKTGGSYISEILEKYYGFKTYYLQRPDHQIFCGGKDKSVKMHENYIHGTLMYYKSSDYINRVMNMNRAKWDNYFIFTFVRNPYDKIVSGWNYCNNYNIPFSNYLQINRSANEYDYWHVFMPQVRHLINEKGLLGVNFIGKFEKLEEDLAKVLLLLGIKNIIHKPFKKNGRVHKNYLDYYEEDKNNIQIVNEILKEDFEKLDYEKMGGKDGDK